MGFRLGLLVGVLATAVVALGVAVVVLVGKSGTTATTIRTVADLGPPCKLRWMGSEVEIEVSSEAISCGDARGVFTRYQEATRSGRVSPLGKAPPVEGWSCEGFPMAEYPLIARCRHGGERFSVIGLAPSAHKPPPRERAASSPEPVYFQTPSGNIACDLRSTNVRCDIGTRGWTPPPRPANCGLAWGNAIRLYANGSTFLCASNTLVRQSGESGFPILKYGESVAVGKFLCQSQRKRLVCVNVRTKHGILLSVQELKLF